MKVKNIVKILLLIILFIVILGYGKVQAAHDIDCEYFDDELYFLKNDGVEYKVISESSSPKIVETQWSDEEGKDIKTEIPANEIVNLEFSSSDEDIATVDSSTGEITIKKTGTFYVQSKEEKEFAVEVIKEDKYNEAMNSREKGTNLFIYGEHASYYGREVWIDMITKAQIYTSTNKEKLSETFTNLAIWSSDENVITVDSEGVIKTVGEGTALVYIDCGDYKDRSILVHVNEGAPTFIMDESDLDIIDYDNTSEICIEIPTIEKIPSSIFKNLSKKQYSTLDVEMNGYSWYFTNNNNEFLNADVDFLPQITIQESKPDYIENNQITNGLFIHFYHEGKLPAPAQVWIETGIDKFGSDEKTLYLYYYNPTTNEYEYVKEVEYFGGSLDFFIDHCSDYVIVENIINENDAEKSKRKLDVDPKTGEESVLIFKIIAITSMMIIMFRKIIIK